MKIGMTYETLGSGVAEVVGLIDSVFVMIKFHDTGSERKCRRGDLRAGKVKDKFKRSIYGVGFIGDGDFKSSRGTDDHAIYVKWHSMMKRCYDPTFQESNPAYIGCTVCDEWHNYQNFAEWMSKLNHRGMQLDKDIIRPGNKEYSPTTCSLVTAQKNSEAAFAKNYKFTSPEGVEVCIYNLNKFCKENGLRSSHMSEVFSGKRKTHKGWSA